jgi:tetratricopeptide (TPR) repeat protein
MDKERHILAAQGYVELGLYTEARRALQGIAREDFERPDVIELGVMCFLGEQRWSEALAMAHELCAAAPALSGGYIHAAYCLHEMKRTPEAIQVLRDGPKILQSNALYYYNLGCYHACLGQIDEALNLLRRSFHMESDLRRVARNDPDLEVLRDRLALLLR